MRITIELDNGATTTHDLPQGQSAPQSTYSSPPGTGPARAGAVDAGGAPVMAVQPGATEPGAGTSGVSQPGAPPMHSTDAQSAGAGPKLG